jgi:hypothetical protein
VNNWRVFSRLQKSLEGAKCTKSRHS